MSCAGNCTKKVTETPKIEGSMCENNCRHNSSFVIIIVLYILLAIIVSSYIC